MKPKLLYDVIRQTSPRKLFPNVNRYSLLPRDASPADSVRSNLSNRSRSQSIKRKNPESEQSSQVTYAQMATGSGSGSDQAPIADNQVEVLTENIVKVKSICDKVSSELSNVQIDPALISVFSLINEAIGGLCDNQLTIVDKVKNGTALSPGSGSGSGSAPCLNADDANTFISVSQKRFRQDDRPQYADLATLRSSQQVSTKNTNTPTAEEQKVKKFKEVVRDAEKSTLIFGLNLGRVPLINQDAMSTKVTKAITEKAAKHDGSKGSIPKEETIIALDDVLSVVKDVRFYGKTTKSYTNPKDPLNGSYCTIPVRYEFNDKDSRIYAETVLRDKCKIQCTTPYPTILREAIKQVQESVKTTNPNCFVKVNVDTSSMTLKVSKRPMLAEGETGKKIWSYVGSPIPIPVECLDVHARKVPDGFAVKIHDATMDTSEPVRRNSRNSSSSATNDQPALG
jgi:hypothetical protein